MNYVAHHFTDAADVAPAWELTQDGQLATGPQTLATQERLSACT